MFKYFTVLLFATVSAQHIHAENEYRGISRVVSPGHDDIQGNITFTQLQNGKVHVEGTILGVSHGKYGFHVHEKGDITAGCISTGGHFNPEHKNHGHPTDTDRHVGDLGNIEFDDNRIGRVDIVDDLISLTGKHSIIGRAVVLHERGDDFGRSVHPDSKKTGNAGGRIACGVIGILEPIEGWRMNSASSMSSSALVVLLSVISYLKL